MQDNDSPFITLVHVITETSRSSEVRAKKIYISDWVFIHVLLLCIPAQYLRYSATLGSLKVQSMKSRQSQLGQILQSALLKGMVL